MGRIDNFLVAVFIIFWCIVIIYGIITTINGSKYAIIKLLEGLLKFVAKKNQLIFNISYIMGIIIIRFCGDILNMTEQNLLVIWLVNSMMFIGYTCVSIINFLLIYNAKYNTCEVSEKWCYIIFTAEIIFMCIITAKFDSSNYILNHLIDYVIDIETGYAAYLGFKNLKKKEE